MMYDEVDSSNWNMTEIESAHALRALHTKLSPECKAYYTGDTTLDVDPSDGYEMTSDGYLVEFEDGITTVEKMLDYADVELNWYVPSQSAIEFMVFIRLCLGEEPENSNPKAHYFFIDCVFQEVSVEPYFRIRNIDYDELKDRVAILSTREFGKALTMDSLVATPDGYVQMGDLREGDRVISRTGEPTHIIKKSRMFFDHDSTTFKMTLEDGRELMVSGEHEHILWRRRHDYKSTTGAYRPAGMEEIVMETLELDDAGVVRHYEPTKSKMSGIEYKYYVPRMDKPIEFNEVDTPVDPYVVGLILGDGSVSKTTGHPRFTSHKDDWPHIRKHVPYNIGVERLRENTIHTSFLKISKEVKEFIGTDRSYTKKIPKILLCGSVNQRLSLLQGLMDTDGTINKEGSMEYNTVSEQLAKDVQELVWSLGGKAKITSKKTSSDWGICYRVSVGINGMDVFRLPRKLKRQTYIQSRDYTAIVSLERVNTEPMQCITVACPTQSFIAHNGVVTHNSVLMAYLFLYMAVYGELPNFGNVNYGIYCGDSMENNVKSTMKTIRKVYLESTYLSDKFESALTNLDFCEFVRKPQTKYDIERVEAHIARGGKLDEAPGRMKRTLSLKGIGASSGGKGSREGLARPHFNVFDDLVQSKSDASSKAIMSKIENTIESDILPGLNNNKNFAVLIGTPYTKTDPVYRRIEERSWLPVVFPRGTIKRNGKSYPMESDTEEVSFSHVWEDRHSYKNCRKAFKKTMLSKENGNNGPMRDILQEHYLRISSSEDRMIPDSLVMKYSRADLEKNIDSYNIYITTDFTTTSNSKSDLSGILCWAVGSNMDWFLLDISLRKLEIMEQYEELFRMAKYYGNLSGKAVTVGIETDGQQKAHIFAIEQMMVKKGEYFTIGRQRGSKVGSQGILSRLEGGNKHWRFRMILPMFQNRKFHFPDELEHTSDMRELYDEIKYATYESFGGKDDGLDCISQTNMLEVIYPSVARGGRANAKIVQSEESRFWDESKERYYADVHAGDSYT